MKRLNFNTQFYQDLVTEKSWFLLNRLKKEVSFVLIGGWAVYLYTNSLKSKDIDIIIDYSALEKLRKDFLIHKNERLKKYEIKKEGIDIDIYLPYYSYLGLAVEKVIKETEQLQGFTVAKKEVLLITKIFAYLKRKTTIKGQKDLIDIISLLLLPDFDFDNFKQIIKKENLTDYQKHLEEIITDVKELPELNLNRHFYSKKKKEILLNLKN
jgi:hypothetical protein